MRKINLMKYDIPYPTPEEILKEDFNLPKYMDEIMKNNPEEIDFDKDWDYFNIDENREKKEVSQLEKLERNYYLEIDKIISQYEKDYLKGEIIKDIYTEKMKKITEIYLKEKTIYELIEQKKKILELKKLEEKKKQEKKQKQRERIKQYENGTIELLDLLFDDINYIKIDKKTRKKLLKLIPDKIEEEKIFEKKTETMSIRELAREYLENKGKTR